MLTNPNTCGIFEPRWSRSPRVHEAGGYFYCDGANLNAIMGKAKPGELGVDAMHINLHKTFSTPAWAAAGRAPGRWCCRRPWRRSRRCPFVQRDGERSDWSSTPRKGLRAQPLGPDDGIPRPMGMFVRAMAWMLSHGSTACGQASETRAQRQLHPRRPAGLHDGVVPGPSGDARGAVRRPFLKGHLA
jgi:glycine dehydrogenase subunit 2